MSSPQKENGYTPIANELMDALSKYRIPGEQMQCLIFIIRKTYGFNKKDDMISNSQFVDGTGLKKGNVSRALKSLVEKRVVIKSDNRRIPTYRFNKNYLMWCLLSKKQPVIKKATSVIKSDNSLLSKAMDTKDNTTKDTITKENILYPDWLDMELWKEFKAFRKHKDRKALSPQAEKLNISKLRKLMDDGETQRGVIEQAIEKNYSGLFPVSGYSGGQKKESLADYAKRMGQE